MADYDETKPLIVNIEESKDEPNRFNDVPLEGDKDRTKDPEATTSNHNDFPSRAKCKESINVTILTGGRESRVDTGGSVDSLDDIVELDDDDQQKLELEHEVLSAKYESLDYDMCENTLFQNEERNTSSKSVWRIEISRWIVMLAIGMSTGLVACAIDIMVENVSRLKFDVVQQYVTKCVSGNCLYQPMLIWISMNIALVCFASILTVYIEPVSAGSGIPQIKCFLNGVKIPRVVRLKTLMVKVIGVVGAVGGGLCVGKEGPMIHSGAVLAAGISQGRSHAFNINFNLFDYFRSDTEKRDFVAGGAAAGVAAAFGAPVGGVLFSLEEGASFWNQALVWRIFFASMMSTFTLNVVMSYYKGTPWALSSPGLINFGEFKSSYQGSELPIFMVMGVIGGLLGALFNHINLKLTLYRQNYLYRNWTQVLETCIVSMITATAGFVTIYYMNVCERMKRNEDYPVQFFCDDGYFSHMAKIFFQTPESSVIQLFHEPPGSYKPVALTIYVSIYFFIASWTYGLSIPSGLFIPSLLVGAAWGRLIGIFIQFLFPDSDITDPTMYSLIGAAAQLGGVVRMTISLTVIIIEATSSVTCGFPVMVVLLIAKWVGDLFNEGLYDIHIRLASVPFLDWEPPVMSGNISAKEVMSHPVTVLRTTENVERIVEILRTEPHNGFPVVEDYVVHDGTGGGIEDSTETETFGVFRGIILRSQLLVLLKYKVFNESDRPKPELHSKDFRDIYPRFPPIQQIHISRRERNCTSDLTPYMNPAAYIVEDTASLNRIFRLFRALGMRHIVVLNKHHRVVGIVTRKDLARYRVCHSKGRMSMEELLFSHN